MRFELALLSVKEKVTQRVGCTDDNPTKVKLERCRLENNMIVFGIFEDWAKRSFFSLLTSIYNKQITLFTVLKVKIVLSSFNESRRIVVG